MIRMLNQAKNDDDFSRRQNIFLVGIKGVAMADLAVILTKMGKKVSGSDIAEEFITDDLLKKNGVPLTVGFDINNIPQDIDLVIYSSGHLGKKNPQVLEAKKRGINTVTQAEFLGEFTKYFKTTIAVCGCHGKTTTSSLLAYALKNLGAKPSYLVGSSQFNNLPGGDYEGNDYFVVEADEYGVNPPYDLTPKFHFLKPDYILCTNIDFDHPDVYPSLAQVKESFLYFFLKLYDNFASADTNLSAKKLFFCTDDKNLMAVAKKLEQNKYLTYGFRLEADLQILNVKIDNNSSLFNLSYKGKHLGEFSIQLFGEKNISNAAGVILVLLQLGFTGEKIKDAIKNFSGAKRRYELIYQSKETYLFDDYAHHPQEIAATINATRARFPKKRIVVIFQPHTYSRTQALLKDFATSLSLADKTYILPIFPSARENVKNFKVSSNDIARLNSDKIIYVDSKHELLKHLTPYIKQSEVIFTMGAGDVYKLKEEIIPILRSKAA